MNSIEPSGPDGSPTRSIPGQADRPRFASSGTEANSAPADLQKYTTLVPAEPSAEQWADLQQRILSQVANVPRTPSPFGARKPYSRAVFWASAAAILLVGTLGLFAWISSSVPLETVADTFVESKPGELAPMPHSIHPNEPCEPYPLVEAGEFIVVAFEPVPGCGEPIFPPEGCPNCPVVYAAARP